MVLESQVHIQIFFKKWEEESDSSVVKRTLDFTEPSSVYHQLPIIWCQVMNFTFRMVINRRLVSFCSTVKFIQ